MNKKILFIIIFVGVLGSTLNSVFSEKLSSAGILDNFLQFLNSSSTALGTKQEEAGNKITEDKTTSLYKPTENYENAVVKAVEEAAPSVVSIVVKKDLPIIENCPTNPFGNLPPEFQDFFGNGFPQFYEKCEKGTEKREIGGGTGFIVSKEGLIMTNKHVIRDKDAEYTVLTNDGKKYDAKVLAQDPVQDIAFIKINATGLRPVKLGDSDAIKLGQTAIAIGNALGEFRNTVSVGVISGLARTITASGGDFTEKIEGVIQTDAGINQGNSGGPLLNLKGEVIGMNTAIASGAENIGFAIPINQAKRGISSVKSGGKIKSPYIGVRYMIINAETAKKQNLPVDYGALVRGNEEGPGVISKSPADKAGVKAEDIILEVNGKKLDDGRTLSGEVQKHNIGDKITIKIMREKQTLNLQVKLEERPEAL